MSLQVDMEQLIELIKQYPFLYDTKNKDYKNVDAKEKCWEEISMQVDISVDDCKRLWRNLRDRFNKEKRIQTLGSEATASTWQYYSKMLFYSNYSSPRKTVVAASKNSLKRSRSASSDSQIMWSHLELSEIESDTNQGQEFSSATPSSQASHTIDYEKLVENTSETSQPKSKRIKQENSPEEFEEVSMPVVGPFSSKYDTNETFGLYIVSRLKEMHPDVAKHKRKKMLAILEDEDCD